jgi:hypothetical protein
MKRTHAIAPRKHHSPTEHPPHRPSTTMKRILHVLSAAALGGLCTLPARAHEGHGLPGVAHWHGTDVLGFMAAIAVVALIWFRGDK